ncbi:MAG: hypothetical protein VR69_14925 [Peptococcaceae bacterium BRH_c4b]|nr:MAG: hypothetical protein VR69_14925 [Peptococcaceae bacterium BRH_c4b]
MADDRNLTGYPFIIPLPVAMATASEAQSEMSLVSAKVSSRDVPVSPAALTAITAICSRVIKSSGPKLPSG